MNAQQIIELIKARLVKLQATDPELDQFEGYDSSKADFHAGQILALEELLGEIEGDDEK